MSETIRDNAERQRLDEDRQRRQNWKRWGPYLAERQWGTVREDYSPDGDAWAYFPHDHARSRAYRWGEDGLLGICDRQCRLCFALALWNGRDTILKERLFGLTNAEGNHGEDVKEAYFYTDATPTSSYLKALYKYPQSAFPYQQLVAESKRRSRHEPEYELADTGIFDESRYFDVQAEYAKGGPDDLLIRITITNRGPESARLDLLPTLWFRNTWSWGCQHEGCWPKPTIQRTDEQTVQTNHATLGRFSMVAGPSSDGVTPRLLMTDNETNTRRLYDDPKGPRYAKDGFHDAIVAGSENATKDDTYATKVAWHYALQLDAGDEITVCLRLSEGETPPADALGTSFQTIFQQRRAEADAFYDDLHNHLADAPRTVARQAHAGLVWSKQFYHYVVKDWLAGDPNMPAPPQERQHGRNADWSHLFNRDVISMPDAWEYPWYAAWDLAFHMIPFARLDADFARQQLILFLREWYMHPNGQIPAYEFSLSDVNPPVHAWACWRVYKMTGGQGQRDRLFLARTFQKLMLNFTWWVNRKDVAGRHVFTGGFLGLDNIGLFDRSHPLPSGRQLHQADGTAWMAFYCATMLSMALELASEDPEYEDVASKFFEHFMAIADAMNCLDGSGLWDDEDGFYYDHMNTDGQSFALKVRSMVGLLPIIACGILDHDVMDRLPGFAKRMNWFIEHRKDLARHMTCMTPRDRGGGHVHCLLAIPAQDRLERVLAYMLDENEFLSPFGIRSLSRAYHDQPYVFHMDGQEYRVGYVPGESDSAMFGGNSNWRGPIWFPVNYLLIEALERYHHFYGDSLTVECPTGSGHRMNLKQVAGELSRRLSQLFLRNGDGKRPCDGQDPRFADDPHWRDLCLFHEYFHGDTGRGLGACHQTGWTALVTECLRKAQQPH